MIPVRQLESLSIEDEEEEEEEEEGTDTMEASPETARRRAIILQEILSSLNKDELLPSEIAPSIFAAIDRSLDSRPQRSEWTITSDLQGTIMNWACYDNSTWNAVRKWQSANARAVAYKERLQRRFKACIERYDDLGSSPHDSVDTVKQEVHRIAYDLEKLCEAVSTDRQTGRPAELESLEIILTALGDICQRADPITLTQSSSQSTRRSPRRPSVAVPRTSLFHTLIDEITPTDSHQPFMLGTLELFSNESLRHCLRSLIRVNGELSRASAPQGYIDRFERLQERAREEESKNTGGSSSQRRTPQSEEETKVGGKRVQRGEPEVATKRGRRRE